MYDRIGFTHSYFLSLDPKQFKAAKPYPPLATITAASFLRENGYDCVLHDVTFQSSPDAIAAFIRAHQLRYLVIYDDGFNYLTKMCLTNMREAAFEMIAIAREMDCTVIVSSSDATDHAEKYLDKGADFVIAGEAEVTLLELIQALTGRNKTEFSSIPGLLFRDNNALHKTAPRKVVNQPDFFPLPAWDLIDINSYREMWEKHHGYFSLNIVTTRGCPYKCNWCAKPIYGNRYTARSPEHVVEEIRLIGRITHLDHIWFSDDIFGLKPDWVVRFAELVKDAQLHFRYKIQSRADLLVDEAYVKALADSGCEEVWMGAESGSQKILDAMDKGISIAQIEEATGKLKAHGIKPAFFLQFGYLGEKIEDIQLTLSMLYRLMPYDIGVSVSYPLPGTGFYEKVKTELYVKSNWTDSDELALMFKNTYKPKFYKRLHRYVHQRFRALQGIHDDFGGKLKSMLYHYPVSLYHALLLKIYLYTK